MFDELIKELSNGAVFTDSIKEWVGSLSINGVIMMIMMIFMIIDYATGMIVAAVFHRTEKTASGTLESRAGWKGLCRKGASLLVVLIACRLDLLMGTSFIRDTVVIGFIANETISIVENVGLMGVPIPRVIVSAIHVLKTKADAGADKIEKPEEKKPPDDKWREDLDDPEG